MSSNSNKVKAEFLGMSYGSACGKLRKQLLFSCVQRLGEDICFRCGNTIENIDNFSIDHKKYWLHTNVELFWDLNNIAFSHLHCNNLHRRYVDNRIHKEENGMIWCGGCQQQVPVEKFGKLNKPYLTRKYRYYCNGCRAWRRKHLGKSKA